ncbi:MAG TPA: hypothetical protein VIK71_02535 [Flavobacteriales bacterium]
MSLKKTQQTARYNNFVMDFTEVLEEDYMDLRMFTRLLAMESEYKEWLEQQIAAHPNQSPVLLSEQRIDGARVLSNGVTDLSNDHQIYIISTPESNAELN